MSTVILSGTTLLEYVQQARNVCGPDFPIIGLNRQYHIEPSKTFNSLPHTEVDGFNCSYSSGILYFNSLPHTEVDQAVRRGDIYYIFQLTTSHRGRRIQDKYLEAYQLFQLTTSHRGRQESLQTADPAEIFQLTTSHRGRLYICLKSMRIVLFQLTTSHRGRL